ncbi:hypothetical protein Poli38472_004815 [Pythium oligandrum]|uniref:Uncharacterized protein n=1 Tax=Pythium oligandrum TaxID=41045 RepID=A0A8K1FES2_PYTOL|nr:hypothetical protein Poli38472_004815 [Pythium oligandrum]|eukprot:TMW59746.1 hypothetical protein Poli38472_004815 [Pythium oligandrum]
MTHALTVARIPALVREVDAIVETFEDGGSHGKPSDVVEICEGILARIDQIEEFRATLRPGPLHAIVEKQITRLGVVLECLHGSATTSQSTKSESKPLSPIGVDKRKRRQIVPTAGGLLIKRMNGGGLRIRPGTASKQVTVQLPKHPKPIYKWEKRRPAAFVSSDALKQPSPSYIEDETHEAAMELRPCSEPGHHIRICSTFPTPSKSTPFPFEFQILLTESEVKALKFQRRQLEAEHRHLKRQHAKPGS